MRDTESERSTPPTSPSCVYIRRLIGGEAYNRDGKRVGQIVDIAIEPARGVVAFFVLRYRDEHDHVKRFAIPMTVCEIADDHVIVNVDPSVFARSPGRW